MDMYKKKILKKGLRWTSLFIGIAAFAIIASKSGNKEELLEPSLETVIENYEDTTLLDDVIALSDEDSETEASMENINKLESRIKLIEKIEKLKLKDNGEISEELKEKYESLSEEDVAIFMEILENEDAKPIELERIKAGLAYLEDYYKNWVVEKGTDIAEDLMKKACKQAACQISGLEPKYYNEWKIGVVGKNEYENNIKCFDPVSFKQLNFELYDVYLDASNTLCNLQHLQTIEENDYSVVSKYCIDALNKAKIICVSDAELKEDGVFYKVYKLMSSNSEKEAKEELKQLQ